MDNQMRLKCAYAQNADHTRHILMSLALVLPTKYCFYLSHPKLLSERDLKGKPGSSMGRFPVHIAECSAFSYYYGFLKIFKFLHEIRLFCLAIWCGGTLHMFISVAKPRPMHEADGSA